MRNAMEDANSDAAREQTTYGNTEGRGLLGKLVEMKTSLKRMEFLNKTCFTNLRSELNDKEIKALQSRVKLLSWSSGGYQKIRHRLFETYRRDVKVISIQRGGRCRFHAIAILNAAATLRVKGPGRMPPEVDSAFPDFLSELEPSLGKSWVDKEGGLQKAYQTFWQVYERHI